MRIVEQMLTDDGVLASPDMPTRATCGAWLALRLEVIGLQEFRKRLNSRAAADAGVEGRGKRTHKGKVR
jgi:hypothetical protein